MNESDKKKIGEAYLRLHSDDKKKPMTPEEAIKELREASDSEVRYGDTEHHYDEVMKRVEALDLAIKALEIELLTDTEQRIFLRAISRERNVCQSVDDTFAECAIGTDISLVQVCDSIERKVKKIWE